MQPNHKDRIEKRLAEVKAARPQLVQQLVAIDTVIAELEALLAPDPEPKAETETAPAGAGRPGQGK